MTKESSSSAEPPEVIFNGLINAAKRGDWSFVDQGMMPKVCEHPQLLEWALRYGIKSENSNLRDFSVSFAEKSTCKFNSEQVDVLKNLMQKDRNCDVRHRAGFALFNHNIRSDDVIRVIIDALKDPSIRGIAQGYLGQLEKPKKFFFFSRDAGN